jgi:hypothetical protein
MSRKHSARIFHGTPFGGGESDATGLHIFFALDFAISEIITKIIKKLSKEKAPSLMRVPRHTKRKCLIFITSAMPVSV